MTDDAAPTDPLPDVIRCCDRLQQALADPSVPLGYAPQYREVGVHLIGRPVVDNLTFCPFCGSALPSRLRDQWFEDLERLGIEDPWHEDAERIPVDYRSDVWWRSREDLVDA